MIIMGYKVADRNVVADYLVTDKEDREKQRAQHIYCVNLPTENPYEAVEVMRLNDLYGDTDYPAYHLPVSFPVEDSPRLNAETMRDISLFLMKEINCRAHQAILVAHEDRLHPHFHLLIERRNPETNLLWKPPIYRRLHMAARLAEREFGLIEAPSHLAKLPDQQWPDKTITLPIGARRARWRTMEAIREEHELAGVPLEKHQRPELELRQDAHIKQARADLGPYFNDKSYTTLEELTEGLANHGYELRPAPSRKEGVVYYSLQADAAVAGSYIAPNASYYALRV